MLVKGAIDVFKSIYPLKTAWFVHCCELSWFGAGWFYPYRPGLLGTLEILRLPKCQRRSHDEYQYIDNMSPLITHNLTIAEQTHNKIVCICSMRCSVYQCCLQLLVHCSLRLPPNAGIITEVHKIGNNWFFQLERSKCVVKYRSIVGLLRMEC